jgi:PelA/Pel-15E family pectate lyase
MKVLRWIGFLIWGAAMMVAAPAWDAVLKQPDVWYESTEARAVANSIMDYQSEFGGWPKNLDMLIPPTDGLWAEIRNGKHPPTIDNRATTVPMTILARIYSARSDPEIQSAIERGIDYLLDAQYENGGWPQYYPLRKGYYTHITFNDGAMVNVLELLRSISRAEAPWHWVDLDRRAKSARALERGIDCILKTQVSVEGTLAVWCAQHHEVTLAPVAARNYEIISLSGSESVGVIRFLMGIESPSSEVRQAIRAAVAWFDAVRIPDRMILHRPIVIEGQERLDQGLADDRGGPGVWARFYEIGTNRPIFAGRDKQIHDDLAEVEVERRSGYAYYGEWPLNLLTKNYPSWEKRVGAAPIVD